MAQSTSIAAQKTKNAMLHSFADSIHAEITEQFPILVMEGYGELPFVSVIYRPPEWDYRAVRRTGTITVSLVTNYQCTVKRASFKVTNSDQKTLDSIRNKIKVKAAEYAEHALKLRQNNVEKKSLYKRAAELVPSNLCYLADFRPGTDGSFSLQATIAFSFTVTDKNVTKFNRVMSQLEKLR